jgi:hypothetical protein
MVGHGPAFQAERLVDPFDGEVLADGFADSPFDTHIAASAPCSAFLRAEGTALAPLPGTFNLCAGMGQQ